MVKQSASEKRVIRDPLTSYELDSLSDYALMANLEVRKSEVDQLILVAMAREEPQGGEGVDEQNNWTIHSKQ